MPAAVAAVAFNGNGFHIRTVNEASTRPSRAIAMAALLMAGSFFLARFRLHAGLL